MEQVKNIAKENSQRTNNIKNESGLFAHKSFEKRLAEYNGEISIRDFDWSEPVGKEIL